MTMRSIQLLTENLPEQRCLQAIFLEERQLGLVSVSSYLLASTAVAAAELYLLQNPEQPVALVLNAGTTDPERVERKRASIGQVLSRITQDNWVVIMAIPDVDSWVSADPRVRALRTTDQAFDGSRHERAARIGELARVHPLDRGTMAQAHPEFAFLVEFIEQHVDARNQTGPRLNCPT